MALRFFYAVLAVTMLVASGCRTRSNYQPAYAPAVVGTTPAPAASCPQAQVPVPPPPAVLAPR